jgi:hypothetical protein
VNLAIDDQHLSYPFGFSPIPGLRFPARGGDQLLQRVGADRAGNDRVADDKGRGALDLQQAAKDENGL